MKVLQAQRRIPAPALVGLAALGGVALLGVLWGNNFLVSTTLEPHGTWYLWDPGLVALHFTTDLLIGLSYLAISSTLLYLVYRARRDLPFHWIFLAFGTFIVACGITHLIEVATLWRSLYWLAGGAKALTALASVATALALPPLVPKALTLIAATRMAGTHKQRLAEQAVELAERNATLSVEVAERRRAEAALRASEEQFRNAFDYAAIGMALVGLDGRWLQVNAALCEIVGYTAEELQTMAFQEISHPDDLEEDLSYTRMLLAGEIRHYQMEKRYRHKDGRLVPILLTGSLVHDVQGRPLHFITQIQDLTARKQVEDALRQAEERERFARVFQASPHGITLARVSDHLILEVNDSWVGMTGISKEEAIGTHGAELGIWDDPADREQLVRLLREQGAVRDYETRLRRRTGEVWYGSTAITPIAIGGEPCWLSMIQDITARKQMEERARAAERLGALGRVAAGVAHEFNNALTGVMGRLDLLALEIPDPAQAPSLHLIQQAVEDAAAVVKRVQTFTRLRSPGTVTAVPVNDLINDVVALTQPRWHTPPTAHSVAIILRTQVEQGLVVYGNPTELREVLTNLILNAIDSQPRDGEILIAAARQEDRIMIHVRDSGIGMDAATRQRVFEPFFTTKLSGSGLGLAVVKDIVESHGGAIAVASAPDAGTTFTVTLPAGAPPVAGVGVGAPLPLPGTARILVVDDDARQVDLLRAMLLTGGHEVVTATGGREALALLGGRPFDLVCTDLGMPGLNGWEVAREVRRRAPGTLVGLITGWGHQLDPADLAGGAVDFVLPKPYRLAAVQRVIGEALQARLAGLRGHAAPIASNQP